MAKPNISGTQKGTIILTTTHIEFIGHLQKMVLVVDSSDVMADGILISESCLSGKNKGPEP